MSDSITSFYYGAGLAFAAATVLFTFGKGGTMALVLFAATSLVVAFLHQYNYLVESAQTGNGSGGDR